MARIRTIKPDVTLDYEFAQLGYAARYFFINLWCHCDREGRTDDAPEKLGILILGWERVLTADMLLNELSPHFVIRYEIGGKKYLQVRNFLKHQRPNVKENPSEIPPPPESELFLTCKNVLKHSKTLDKGKGIDKGNGVREGNTDSSEPDTAPASEPSILVFPTVGKSKTWGLPASFLEHCKTAFPALDVSGECRRALLWCEANPAKRKTPRGMPAFLQRWLERSQNRSGNGNRNEASGGFNGGRISGYRSPSPGKYAE